jgi:hypothetical protein
MSREEETELNLEGARISRMKTTQTKVSNITHEGFGAGWDLSGRDGHEEESKGKEVQGDFKMAWMWVQGWRANLRVGGDEVEKCRHL